MPLLQNKALAFIYIYKSFCPALDVKRVGFFGIFNSACKTSLTTASYSYLSLTHKCIKYGFYKATRHVVDVPKMVRNDLWVRKQAYLQTDSSRHRAHLFYDRQAPSGQSGKDGCTPN